MNNSALTLTPEGNIDKFPILASPYPLVLLS
jgi:hypothetical protein